jgi:hypothetical protein
MIESVQNCSAAMRFICHSSAMLGAATNPDEVPARACNDCGSQMKHVADLCSAGLYPAERIFRCQSCSIVISERR